MWEQCGNNYIFFAIFTEHSKTLEEMATNFFLRTTAVKGEAPLFVRLRSRKFDIDWKLSTNLDVDIVKWNNAHINMTKLANFKKTLDGKKLFAILDEIEKCLDSYTDPKLTDFKLTKELAKELLGNIVFKEQRAEQAARDEAERLKAIEDSKETFLQYATRFVDEAISGKRKFKKNNIPTQYQPNSTRNLKQTLRWIKLYEKSRKVTLLFEDITEDFAEDFVNFMEAEDSSINTIGAQIKSIRTFAASAFKEGKHRSVEYQILKSFKVDVDSIALTDDELRGFEEVDLSNLHPSYSIARDLFLIGVGTAQRVSDYGAIRKENIKSYKVEVVEHNSIVEKQVYIYSITRQQKTGSTAAIPITSKLLRILERYNFQIPKMHAQKLNDYIKVIGEMAGINGMELVKETKGGRTTETLTPRYALISSHTARRTGATLMYLAGVDVYDIMTATGHKTISNLEKYIKVKADARALMMAKKYSYFSE